MPEAKRMQYATQHPPLQMKRQGRSPSPKGSAYPAKPGGKDGNYEHTAAGKTKLNKF